MMHHLAQISHDSHADYFIDCGSLQNLFTDRKGFCLETFMVLNICNGDVILVMLFLDADVIG